jgi:hypothetical protein
MPILIPYGYGMARGLAEALSTSRTAADFCEKYDGLVFNHN